MLPDVLPVKRAQYLMIRALVLKNAAPQRPSRSSGLKEFLMLAPEDADAPAARRWLEELER